MSNEINENIAESPSNDSVNISSQQFDAPVGSNANPNTTMESGGANRNVPIATTNAATEARSDNNASNAAGNIDNTSAQQPQRLHGHGNIRINFQTGNNPNNNASNININAQPQQMPAGRQVPIRINLRNRSGQPMPPPRIHVDRNGQMHLNIGPMVQTASQMPQNNVNTNNSTAAAAAAQRTPIHIGSPTTPNGRRIHIHPLVPQPIEDSTTTPSPIDGEQWNKYKCVISLELLEDPVGCGNCASRFSRACLERYTQEQQKNHPQQTPKCPTCRVEMSRGMVPDTELQEEMKTCGPVACRFEGCSSQLLLPEIKGHERSCPHVMVKCRYAPYGCDWKGKRGDFALHESSACHYAKVSGLVGQFRLLAANHAARMDAIEQQNALNLRLEAARQQNLQRSQRVCKTNLFPLLEYCHLLTCNTTHVIFSQERWAPYFGSEEGRALVTNFCALTPLAILFGSTALGGMRDLLRLVETSQDNEPNKPYLLADSVLSLCVGLLGVLMLAANFSDVRSSKTWHRFELGSTLGKAPVIGDVMALSSFTILESAFEVLYVGFFKCVLLWWLLTLCTAFYPVVILTLSESLPRSQRIIPLGPRQVLSRARAMEPLLFGLRYGLLGYLFGPIPCLDAAVAINLLPRGPKTDLFRMRNSFMGGLPKSAYAAYFGAQLAILMASNYSQWRDGAFNSLLSMICLPIINYIDHRLFSLAIKTGRKIYTQSVAAVRPQGMDRDYSLLGMAVFGSWVCTLLMIAQF